MTRTTRFTRAHIAMLMVAAFLLAACGGAEGTEAPTEVVAPNTDAPTKAPTDTAAPAATEAETEDGSGDEDEDSGGASFVVEISSFAFNPGTVTVKVGTTVTWLHRDGGASHTVTADDDSFSSGLLSENDRFSFTFDTPGTYAYYCEFHGGAGGAGMSGVITVEE